MSRPIAVILATTLTSAGALRLPPLPPHAARTAACLTLAACLTVTSPPASLAVSGGGKDFSGASLEGQDMSGGQYRGKEFRGIRGAGVIFKNSNLGATSFYKADLSNADFSGADLSSASLEEVRLTLLIEEDTLMWMLYILIHKPTTGHRLVSMVLTFRAPSSSPHTSRVRWRTPRISQGRTSPRPSCQPTHRRCVHVFTPDAPSSP